uniref:High mobility group protein 2 HMG2 n=1 Tax=Solanum tuberosum TaxID=4113 RepID=M1BLY4_SOLTU
MDAHPFFIMKGGKSKGKADNKLGVKKSAAQTKKEKNAAKDPNKPKRPASAFFVFMEDFRKQYKEKHPGNKSVAAVGKAGGDKWKHLTDAEKAPYIAKAEKRKAEYEKLMDAYNRKQARSNCELLVRLRKMRNLTSQSLRLMRKMEAMRKKRMMTEVLMEE